MYDVFKGFLNIDTWHTTHPLDVERFDKILSKIIDDPQFSPSDLGDYFWDNIDEDNSNHSEAVERYVRRADTIQDYLTNIKEG